MFSNNRHGRRSCIFHRDRIMHLWGIRKFCGISKVSWIFDQTGVYVLLIVLRAHMYDAHTYPPSTEVLYVVEYVPSTIAPLHNNCCSK